MGGNCINLKCHKKELDEKRRGGETKIFKKWKGCWVKECLCLLQAMAGCYIDLTSGKLSL